jgi:hypothetical protein
MSALASRMSRVESYLAGLGLSSRILKGVHALLGSNSIGSSHHLNKRMPLVLVDDTCLNLAEAAKDVSNLTFGSTGTTYKECATKHADVVAWQAGIPI